MFPPEKTSDVYAVINNLWSSLRRASNHLNTKSLIRPHSTGKGYYVAIGLQQEIGPKALTPMKAYMKQYAHESGWNLSRLAVHRRHIDFELSFSSKAK